MKPETLAALRASIAHHESNLNAETPDQAQLGAKHCPLCAMFCGKNAGNPCAGCPVAGDDMLHEYCEGTPYDAAYFALCDWNLGEGTREAFLAAEQEEIAFLKSLLPSDGGAA